MSKLFILTLTVLATLTSCASSEENSCDSHKYTKDVVGLIAENIQEPLAYSEASCKGLYTDLYRCCYVRAENSNGDDIHGCVEISYGNFTEIDDYFDLLESQHGYEINQIDCKSSYIAVASLFLFALLF